MKEQQHDQHKRVSWQQANNGNSNRKRLDLLAAARPALLSSEFMMDRCL
jgi:hypothetical protein